MSRSVSLRAWQREALDVFRDHPQPDFLAVACPGAGKTTFALAAMRQHLRGEALPIAIVVPTAHLKIQWADAAARFGFHLEPNWSSADGELPADMHGVVVTYAQAASSARELRALTKGGVVVLDEVHHAAGDRTWGEGVLLAFELVEKRLLLSGTPFRSDDNPIPFVTYTLGDHGDALADYEYGYGEALTDGGVVRPVYFPRFDGHMEWISADGQLHEATFEDDLAKDEWSARLRTALSVDGDWLSSVIRHANDRLVEIRKQHPDAGGLVIATDQEHARGIVELLQRHGVVARLALSDDPNASKVISTFASSDEPWIVAVRMISEGVDIPRLRVGVYATTTTTAMFFRQAVGRIARWTTGLRSQRAYLYVPDDVRLRHLSATIAQQRRHSIDRRKERADDAGHALDDPSRHVEAEEQMSLFSALSSTAVSTDSPDDGIDPDEDLVAVPDDLVGYPVDLPPPPPLPGRDAPVDGGALLVKSRRALREELRERNADRARSIARITGRSHADVNSELNRLAGVTRITEATIAEMERRVAVADKWLDSI